MKKYIAPEFEVELFDCADVITTSAAAEERAKDNEISFDKFNF